jgi:nuclear receptor subfamily 2 group E protein 3
VSVMHTSMHQLNETECFDQTRCLSDSDSGHGTNYTSTYETSRCSVKRKPSNQTSPATSINENSSTSSPSIDSSLQIPARILFMAIKWCKSLPTFNSLPFHDQSVLLEQTWSDMFLICALQCSLPSQANIFLTINSDTADKNTTKLLSDVVEKFRALGLDQNEFSYLKALLLFKPGELPIQEAVFLTSDIIVCFVQDAKGLQDAHLVETIQDQAQLMLAQYISSNPNCQSTRFGKLLLALSILKQIDSGSIEKLYFAPKVGDLSIDKLLCDLIKA